MKKIVFILLLVVSFHLSAQQFTIKFATLAPEGSTWINVMREYDNAVRKESGGRLGFKIFGGGVIGDEKDVIRKIRLGQFHSAGITGVGIGETGGNAQIARILDSPFLFNNYEEVDLVVDVFDKEFHDAFERDGFVLLGWAEVGFVYMFTNSPVRQASDLEGVKMWMWEGDPVAMAAFQALGVSPTPLSITDVLTSLQTNLINGFYTSPLAAISLQWYTHVKYMVEVPLADAAGAVVISKREYDKLPADLQEILLRNGKLFMKKLTRLSRQDNEKSLQVLRKNRIQFTKTVSENELERYADIGRKARRLLVGKLYPEDFLNRVEAVIADFRASHGKRSK